MGCVNYYYRFESLPSELKQKHNISSDFRFDCTAFVDTKVRLLSDSNTEGKLFFYKRHPSFFKMTSDLRRQPEFVLTNRRGCHLSCFFFGDIEDSLNGYGSTIEFIPNKIIRDAHLFVINPDKSSIELFGIEGGDNLIRTYFHKLQNGKMDKEIHQLRKIATPFYDYQNNIGFYNKSKKLLKKDKTLIIQPK